MNRSQIIRKIVPALFYLLAFTVLSIGEFGILTGPGMIAAGLGLALCLADRLLLASGIGIISATFSFLGQAMVGFCPYCAASASAFAIAGLITIAQVIPKKPIWGLIVTPLLASVIVLGVNCYVGQTAAQAVTNQDGEVMDSFSNPIPVNTPKLYISPACPSCTKALTYFIAQDPHGVKWHPVIVPKAMYDDGIKELKAKGYLGSALYTDRSPSNLIPCIVVNRDAYSGTEDVINIGKNLFREEAKN